MINANKNGVQVKNSTSAILEGSGVKKRTLDINSLLIVAVLFAAGCILDFTAGKALAIAGNIKPNFLIASYCLSILLIRPKVYQGAIIGALAATLMQITATIPFMNYLCDIVAAVVMTLLVLAYVRFFPKDANRKVSVFPLIATFITTVVSGMIFASVASTFIMHSPKTMIVMAPIVFGTAVFNAVIVGVLHTPLKFVIRK